jgi:adenosine deaminase
LALVHELALAQIPLTVCPLSNQALCVTPDLRTHNFAKLLRAGVAVTINSDDPAYFGGYIADNYRAIADATELTFEELVVCAENAARAAFVPEPRKQGLLAQIRAVADGV